jgi:hypothetical protein
VARLEEVGERDGWRCWLCDEPVDPAMSVNDPRGPSVDSVLTKAKAKRSGPSEERLAHRGCNTKKGAITPVVPWPAHLFVADAAPILPAIERLQRKGGREIVGRCSTHDDAVEAGEWLLDRLSRLAPGFAVGSAVEQGGGQHLLVLTTR